MKSFVTGASGFIGGNLVRELVARGHSVKVLLRPGSDTRGLDGLEVERVAGDVSDGAPVLTRIHSECLTGDVIGSLRCDCRDQLEAALKKIGEMEKGVVLYLRQEGRGIGLVNKLKAYELQDKGLDTVEANIKLGFKADLRDYGIGAQILVDLGIRNMRLMTNNPKKIVGLEGYGLTVVERISMETNPNEKNLVYLKTKKKKLGHILNKV
jgi:3,4-dihydroxy 2-butanone 4-phosphate synthase/GTP cyclohydrolase II